MSQLKNPRLRYKTLDKCFRNIVKKYFIDDLVTECNRALKSYDPESPTVSKRQIWDDIKFMKSRAGWQIELDQYKEGKRSYYRYSDPTFSIEKMPLTEGDLIQMKSAIEILSQFEGMPQFGWLDELVKRMQYSLPNEGRKFPVVSFDNNQYLSGIEYLGPLYNAINYKKVLSVIYQDFKSAEPYSVIIHPSFLKQYNNRWFLLGYNPERHKSDWILALDRIKAITDLPTFKFEDKGIDWSDYFQGIIGVSKPPNEIETQVILNFFGASGNYVLTKPLHGSQKVKFITSDILEVRLNLIPNYELEQLILSFGDHVLVVSPISLSDKIKARLIQSMLRYDSL